MSTRDPEYLIRCSDGTEERFRAPSDGVALSKTIDRACQFRGVEGAWELFYTGPQFNEPLARIRFHADRSISITDVNF